MKIAIYRINDGYIDMIADVPEGYQHDAIDGFGFLPVKSNIGQRSHCINLDTLKPNLRDTTPCTPSTLTVPADGTTPVTLSQMRADTQIQIRGPVSDTFTASGSEQLTFAVPGRYTITATAAFPSLPREIAINAS